MWCTPHAHASCWDLQLYDTAPPTSLWRVLCVHLNHRALPLVPTVVWCVVPRTSVRVCVMRDGEFLFATACRMSIQSFGDLPLWLFMIII